MPITTEHKAAFILENSLKYLGKITRTVILYCNHVQLAAHHAATLVKQDESVKITKESFFMTECTGITRFNLNGPSVSSIIMHCRVMYNKTSTNLEKSL